MPTSPIRLSNLQARSLWLRCQQLLESPFSAGDHHRISQTINTLGMVQLDSIGVLARAQDHILWSRHTSYRKADFYRLSSDKREVFEHFTHDAAILPISTYPYWQRQFERKSERYRLAVWGSKMACADTQKKILHQISKNGPMCSQDFTRQTHEKADKSVHAWMRPPHKLALDYLWLAGDLSVSHRQGFTKFYDLTTRVITPELLSQQISEKEQTDWLCLCTLQRLGFATAREIQGFYDALSLAEVKTWLAENDHLVQTVVIETASGKDYEAYALMDLESNVASLPNASGRIRIVNPFDPAVRDRKRLKRLFGFDFRIEIYVPANKRRFGYYVCPLLERGKFIGRIEVRADKEADCLRVCSWWLEAGIRPSISRARRLHAELERMARLTEVSKVEGLPEPIITNS